MRFLLSLYLLAIVAARGLAEVDESDDMLGGNMPMPGGYQSRDGIENDANVMKAANFATDKISEKTGSSFSLSKVLSAATQVVAGTNYHIEIETTDGSGAKHAFSATVFESLPYAGSTLELTNFAKKESSSGGSNVEQAAQFAALRISQASNSLIPLELKGVEESVVEGSKYNLKLKLGREGLDDQLWKVVVEEGAANQFALRSMNQE